MQTFIKLQNILTDPKSSFQEFKEELIKSQITQFTYLCLLLNIAATVKRPNFHFKYYLDLLINFKSQAGFRSACINYTGYKDKVSILMNACQKSVYSTVRILATHPDIKLHLVDPNGCNAVFYAIKNTDQNQGLKILQLLYDLSSQIIDTVTNNGYSPLFLAVQKYRIKIIEFLLSHGTDPNQKLISSSNTALHEMVKIASKYSIQESKKMVQIFLRYDFDLNIRNNQQKNVQEFSLEHKFNISEILKEVKSKRSTNPNEKQYYLFDSSEKSQTTQVYSTKMCTTTTNMCDLFTSYQYSQIQYSDLNYQIDTLSISNKSLLSQQINYYKYDNHRELSLDMNMVNNNNNNNDDNESVIFNKQDDYQQIDEMENKKIEYQSLSDSPQSIVDDDDDFDLSQNLFPQKQQEQEEENDEAIIDDNFAVYNGASQSYSSQQSDDENDDGQFLKTQHINSIKIHQQILVFDQISQQIYFSAWKQIQPFFTKLNQLINGMGLSIEIIGSFATGLWTQHSDIDIALITQSDMFVDFQRLLEKVFAKIKLKMYDMGIKQLSYNKASKIPSLKIQMDPYLFSSRKIDIMIFHKKNMAITYVNYIRQSLTVYYQIRPLFFFLKRACEQFGLHDPFNGGMKSYSIFLLINSIIRSLQLTNLGEILLKISLYFGFYHTYDYEIEHNHNIKFNDSQYNAVQKLNIKDPLNTKNNMGGKNTNVLKLKNMFRTIYYGIHKQSIGQSTLQHILQMAQLII